MLRQTVAPVLLALSVRIVDVSAQTELRRQVAATFAAQFSLQDMLLLEQISGYDGPVLRLNESSIHLPESPDTIGPLLVWRVAYPADHSQDYTIATAPGVLLRLGGFPSSDLHGAAHALQHSIRTSGEARAFARVLALLDAPYAPAFVRFLDDSADGGPDSAVAAWQVQHPAAFPGDTVRSAPDGSYVVGITRLTYVPRTMIPYWSHRHYEFLLASDGELLAYTTYSWPEFILRAPGPSGY